MTRLRRLFLAALSLTSASTDLAAQELPKPLVSGLKNPESVAVGTDGRIYVSAIGEFDKDGDGAILVLQKNKAAPFANGLDDPKGLVAVPDGFYVADKTRVWRIDRKGKAEVLVAADAFPSKPLFLNDTVVDPESGILYVSDTGDLKGGGGAVFRIDPRTKKVTPVTDGKRSGVPMPNGLAMDGASHLLALDFGSGELSRIKLADGSATKIAAGFGGSDGLAWDKFGRLFLSDWSGGQVFGIPRPGEKPVLLAKGFQSAADICLAADGKSILVPDMKAGTVTAIPTTIPGWEVDETPLPITTEVAFKNLRWTGWKPVDDAGRQVPLRPLLLTHAGDDSKRLFVCIQQGTIHVFPNDDKAKETKVFLDISSQVRYSDQENEEGLLGLAFHPKYKTNGEFFVFYTDKRQKLTNVVSRFRVSKDDPDRADPASEEILMQFKKPFWNHDGGTIIFGPDGYLYITHGDGGSANDPYENGQSTKTLLGKVLRIDVDRRQGGNKYAIPSDNPFAGGRGGAAPEIWAYGLRNIWRMAFDRQTGELWAGEVGQNLYEEIILVTKGTNYGWNLRESLHPFGVKGVGPREDLVEPIWEYHHDVGKSVTGGLVYRGKRIPELAGHYLYGDYVTAKIWALKYDNDKKRVVANRPIPDRGLPILSFGEDEQGEAYLMTHTPTGQGIYRFVRTAKGK